MPTILPILTDSDPILRQKSEEVKKLSPEIELLIGNMIETMKESRGVGIAAPQVGKNIKLIVVDHKDEPLVLINPKICKKSLRTKSGEEGCLSIPGVFGVVRRHQRITVRGQNRHGQEIEVIGEGMLARVLQHEIDHLDGILFVDKAVKINDR